MRETAAPQLAYERLHPDVPEVAFLASDCLPGRSPLSRCSECADACPVDALQAARGTLSLADTCLRCGQCAAACPTGALRVSGFPRSETLDGPVEESTAELPVECWRVPREAMDSGALRVPCLAGLDSGTLAELSALRDAPLVLVNRGWCESCPAGGKPVPMAESVAVAASALESAGAPPQRWPRIEDRPLPVRRAVSKSIPLPECETRLGRRELFRQMAGRSAGRALGGAGLDSPAEGAAETRPLVDKIAALPRQRLSRAVRTFAGTVPASMAPRLRVDEAHCCNQRVCASLCPTGALRAVNDGNGSGLDFEPADCIACELCVRVCPERALELAPRDGVSGPVIRHAHQYCRECRAFCPGNREEGLCASCAKKYGLLADGGYELLFGKPAEHPRDDAVAPGRDETSPGRAGTGPREELKGVEENL